MTSSGMSAFARCTCSACGRTLSSAKRWKVSRTSSKSSPRWRGPSVAARPGQDGGVALLAEERRRRIGPPGLDAPEPLPPRHPAHQLGDDVGDERGGDAGLDLPVLAVREGGPGRGHRGRGVRHVVGDHLVGVDPAAVADRGTRLVDEVLGQVDRLGGGGEHGGGGLRHGARP